MRPFAKARSEGQHRHLHHLVLSRKPVDELQGLWMHEVLGIMNHDNFKLDAVPLFVLAHGVVRGVQAVTLGSWSIMGTDRPVHPRIVTRDPVHGL